MTPDTLNAAKRQATTLPADEREAELIIDTSRMSVEQRSALEVAESARDNQESRASFAGGLFMGRVDSSLIEPFPVQSIVDRGVGDALVADVSRFLREHLDPEVVDETRTIPPAVIAGLQTLGVFRMKVPAEYGGLGISQVNYNRVLQAIASYCGSTAVLVSAHQSIGVPQPLKMFGTAEQKQRYLPRISAGALSAFALTESGVGSDPARMTTTATLTPDGRAYILNGEKLWTTNGPIADLLVVMAQTPPKVYRGREKKQITAFIVETEWPGVEVVHRCDFMGLRGIQNGVMRFENVRVPVENILWGEGKGLKLALRTLNTGRLTLPAACSGIAKQCLSIARQWSQTRVQWGRAIGAHEAGAEKITDIAATTFAMEAVTWLTSHWADEGRDIRIEAGMAKLFASEACWRIIDETLQLRGGRGYERATSLRDRGETAYPLERMMRDARINTIIEGTSDIMRLFLAREALDPHLRRAADLLKPGVPWPRRVIAGIRVGAYYAAWYPSQVAQRFRPRLPWPRDPLARHTRHIERTAHRLATRLFGAMVRHGPRLEQRQILLGHLVDVGCTLFAMRAAIGYAQVVDGDRAGAIDLADEFCQRAREDITLLFRAAGRTQWRRANRVAKRTLAGEFGWLERGITPLATETPQN